MKTILITGANRGIGLELTEQYLKDGWQVLACCRDPQKANELMQLEKNASDQLKIFELDVSDEKSIQKLSEKLANEKIDILFNNAGILADPRPTTEFFQQQIGSVTQQMLMESFKINTAGPLLLAQALLKQVERSDLKIIVNMSSTLGSITLNEDGCYYAYRISKVALNAVTKNLAVELRDKKIIIISMHPGWVITDMGGENAEITTEQSAVGMKHVLANLTLKDSGEFFRYSGEKMPW